MENTINKSQLRIKILQAYAKKGLGIENVMADEQITDEERIYATKRMIFRIEDVFEKEKAIANILKLIGEANIDSHFEDDKEKSIKKIETLHEILIYLQE